MRKFFRILGKVLMCIAGLCFLVTLICSFPMARDMGLSLLGNVLIILSMLLMYFGRVGVLTISMGFLKKKPAGEKYRYANTELLIG